MITTNRVVIVANTDQNLSDVNFEAIEVITEASEVEDVWKRNKTPAVLEENAKDIIGHFPTIMLPKFIFGPEDFISFCHFNGFECGERITEKKFDTSKDCCFLCSVAQQYDRKGKQLYPTYLFNQLTDNISDIKIYDDGYVFIKIELGCLTPGMVMICPHQHYLSAASLPDDVMEHYKQAMADIEFLLKAVYGNGPVIFFEHGSSPSGFSSHERSIVHAHTHVAWGLKFPQRYLDMVCLQEVDDIRKLSETKYFSYQEGTTGKLMAVWDPAVYVQRQYPRQVIGEMLGIKNELTNWRKEPFMDNIIKTFDSMYEYLKNNQNFLCERIVKATEGFVKGYGARCK